MMNEANNTTPNNEAEIELAALRATMSREFWALDEEARNSLRFTADIGEALRGCVCAQQFPYLGLLAAARETAAHFAPHDSVITLEGGKAFRQLLALEADQSNVTQATFDAARDTMDRWVSVIRWTSEDPSTAMIG